MSRVIQMIPGEFESMMPNIFTNKENFDEEMYKIINSNEIVDTKIYFPEILSISQRHRIHTFSNTGLITSKSFGEGNSRHIVCFLTKAYIKYLVDRYYIEPEPVASEIVIEDVVAKCRKMMFEAQLKMINEQFGDLFEEYLKSI